MNKLKRFFIRNFTNVEIKLIRECQELVEANDYYLDKCKEFVSQSKELNDLPIDDIIVQHKLLIKMIDQILDGCVDPISREIARKMKIIKEIQGKS